MHTAGCMRQPHVWMPQVLMNSIILVCVLRLEDCMLHVGFRDPN